MSDVPDLEVYQKLAETADELEAMAARASLVGNAALTTAAHTLRGMASAVYQHAMSAGDQPLDS